MSTTTAYFRLKDAQGGLFDPDSSKVYLSDRTGAYSIVRTDTGANVSGISVDDELTRESEGIYYYEITDPASDLTYTAYFKYNVDGDTVYAVATVPGTPSSTGTKKWTRTTLGQHLLAVLPKAARTTSGSVPTALADIVYGRFGFLWECHDWKYTEREGLVSLADGDSEWSVGSNYSDFRKFCQRWLEESGDSPLTFTTNHSHYEAAKYQHSDSAGTLQSGEPELALIVPDTSLSVYGEKLKIVPESNGTYTYPFWYICAAPSLGVTEVPKWPNFMFRLWKLEAQWLAEQAFCKDDRWIKTYQGARSALKRAFTENDEQLVTSTPEFYDGYGDLQALTSSGHPGVSVPIDER